MSDKPSYNIATQPASPQRRRNGHLLNQHPLSACEEEDSSYDGEVDEGYDDVWPPRMPTSTRRYTDVPARQSAAPRVYTQGNRRIYVHHGLPPGRQTAPEIPPPARRQRQPQYEDENETRIPRRPRRAHWMLSVGVGMLAMLALWIVGGWLLQWWQVHQDDTTYGRPRTFQTDAVVGHNDGPANPSHFLALNLNRHVLVIECPGGDCAHAVIYLGPTLFGDGQDLTPVTLTFQDLNGDDKPDMIVHIQDQRLVFLNENGKFRLAKPGEVPL